MNKQNMTQGLTPVIDLCLHLVCLLTKQVNLKKVKGFLLTVLLALSCLILGCSFHRDKSNTEGVEGSGFSVVYNKIVRPKCLSCHLGPTSPKSMDFSSYETILKAVVPFDAEKSVFYESVAQRRMPKDAKPLSTRELEVIRDWIASGAKMNEDVTRPPTEPTYASINENIFKVRCLSCHSGVEPKKGFSVETYEKLMNFSDNFVPAIEPGDPSSSLVYLSVKPGGNMPNEGAKLSTEDVRAIEVWITKGAKQNDF